MNKPLLIRGATIVTMDAANSILKGDILVQDRRVSALADSLTARDYHGIDVIEATDRVVIPGFVQTHIHLCQTVFRGSADDLSLIDWLRKRIWPLEAAHTPESIYASARLGIAELISGGTTCALTMETVQHSDQVFAAVEETGFRATIGKCMMDKGDQVPAPLRELTEDSIAMSVDLLDRWHGRDDDRIRYCFAPRFAVSCTQELLERVGKLSRERGVLVHTHASENKDEIDLVTRETGRTNIEYLRDVGLAANNVVLAHCVHVGEGDIDILRKTGTHVAHCPSSNLKLGSGIAPVVEMLERGIPISLGADGAPCNNRLDMFTEMRSAALIQKAMHGPEVLPALTMLRMATIDGARALGLEEQIGSIEVGKRADLTVLNIEALHTTPHPDPISSIVYAADARDVETVIIDGKIVMREGELITIDEKEVIRSAKEQAMLLQESVS
jgi:5-methylthioadenosine/S-adenosylhomocysteine deaminase